MNIPKLIILHGEPKKSRYVVVTKNTKDDPIVLAALKLMFK
jgi:hypothetical protein